MDEENNELDAGQGRQKSGRGGLRNPGTAAAEKLKGAQKTMEQGSKLAGKAAEKLAGKKSGQLAAKLSAKLGKAGAQAGKAAKVAAKLGKYIATVGWIILLIIAIIGLLVFILTGAGLILKGLKDVATAFFNSTYNYIFGEEDNISDEAILDTMTYIDEMGYDLYGYGFVSESAAKKFYGTNKDGDTNGKVSSSDQAANTVAVKASEEKRELTEEEIKEIQDNASAPSSSDPIDRLVTDYSFTNFFKNMFGVSNTVEQDHYRNILAYLYSDKYAYLIKNKNKNHAINPVRWVPILGDAYKAIVNDWFLGDTGVGLIHLYFDNGTVGVRGDKLSEDEAKCVETDTDSNTLTMVDSGWFSTTKINYSLDGWTGRYSMPLEFLLSTHIATMAPDLSYKLAKTFTGRTDDDISTEVEILLHKTNDDKDAQNNINAAVIPPGSSEMIEVQTLADIINEGDSWWNLPDKLDISAAEALDVLRRTKLESRPKDEDSDYKCEFPFPTKLYEEDSYVERLTSVENEKNQILEVVQSIIDKAKDDSKISLSSLDDLKTEVENYFWSTVTAVQNPVSRASTSREIASSIDLDIMYNGYFHVGFTGTDEANMSLIELESDDNIVGVDSDKYEEIEKQIMTEFCNKVEEIFNVDTSNIKNNQGFKDFIYGYVRNPSQANTNFKETVKDIPTKTHSQNNQNPESSTNPDTNQTVELLKNNGAISLKIEKEGQYDGIDAKYEFNVNAPNRSTSMSMGVNWVITLSYKDNRDNVKDIVCSDPSNVATEACENCTKYVKAIYNALKKIKVDDLQTYVPYIYQVKDHWFRDVYFTKKAAKDAGNSIIQTDNQYEKKTGERWTLYELDPQGKYELYVYEKNKDGDYETNFLKTSNDEDGKYVICQKVETGGDYKLSKDGITYVKQANGPYKLVVLKDATADNKDKKYTDYTGKEIKEFRVGKKAETTTVDDLNWDGAYSDTVDTSSDEWKDLVTNEESPDAIKDMEALGLSFKYQMNIGKINQVKDAVRGETNPKIKELFLDDYYKYDGSRKTAKIIDNFKKALSKKVENDSLKNVDIDNPDDYQKYLGDKLVYHDSDDGTNKEVLLSDVSGPISLTHDALAAFSILKNMHTLDAEYIYHDFKELIVELNYFDKEDLVEPEDEVLMFPVAGVSAAGWPVTKYDKSEEFYGTLIYSAEDLEAKRAEEELELLEKFGIDTEDDFTSENTEQSKSEYESQGGDADYTSSDGSVKITNGPGGAYGADRLVTVNGVTYQQFFQTEAHHNTWELPRADEGPDDPARLEIGCGFCSATSVASAYVSDMDLEVMLKKLKELNLEWSNSAREQKVKKLLNSYGIKGEWQAGASGSKLKEIIEKAFEEGKPVIIRQGANSTAPWKTGRTLSCISWN